LAVGDNDALRDKHERDIDLASKMAANRSDEVQQWLKTASPSIRA
jgi:hypothetical protein